MRLILDAMQGSGPVRGVAIGALLLALVIANRAALIDARVASAESVVVPTSEVLYVPDIRLSRAMALGYDQAAADLLWLRTLDYFARHLARDRQYRWLEHFLDQILELDPRFRSVYHWAGANVLYGRQFTNLNVENSNRFYRRALERFPDDHEAAYRIGLNYYVEMKSTDEDEAQRFREIGLSYLERAANTPGAPTYIRSLVAAVSSRLGKSQLALQYLLDLYMQTEDPETRASLRARIEALRGVVGADAAADAAARFEEDRRALFPYLPPVLFAQLGEPSQIETPDRGWRALVPDIIVTEDDREHP